MLAMLTVLTMLTLLMFLTMLLTNFFENPKLFFKNSTITRLELGSIW